MRKNRLHSHLFEGGHEISGEKSFEWLVRETIFII